MDKSKIIFAAVALVVYVLLNWGKPLLAMAVKKLPAATPGVTPELTASTISREQAFSANVSLVDFFVATGCPEGAAAARLVTPFILHEHAPPEPTT